MRRKLAIACAISLSAGCSEPTQSISHDPDPALHDIYWAPVEIDGKPLVIHAGTREAHIILRTEGGRVTGFTGCNTLAGSFQQSGDTLRFGKLAMTRMACAGEGTNVLEGAFTKALEDTASYRIIGGTLELRNAAAVVQIRFTARPLQ